MHDAAEPEVLVRFWAQLLGWEQDGTTLLPDKDTDPRLCFVSTTAPKVAQNRIHFDLTSTSPEHQRQLIARALDLGGSHVDIGQTGDETHVVLADPEGNEFCVIEPGNSFLAGTGRIGAVNCDGTRELGHFWSGALDWPLVWDQEEETAIQSPNGGPKVTWSGPPLMPRRGKDRLRLEFLPLQPAPAEVDRLVALGATLRSREPDGSAFLADPDGNEFIVSPPEHHLHR